MDKHTYYYTDTKIKKQLKKSLIQDNIGEELFKPLTVFSEDILTFFKEEGYIIIKKSDLIKKAGLSVAKRFLPKGELI